VSDRPVTLVVGVGNRFRGDDAAGPAVVDLLGGVAAIVHDGDPADLMERWAGVDEVVVVDAVRSGAAPGTVTVIDARAVPLPAGWCRSSHAWGPGEAIELARALGTLPARVTVYGIEGADFTPGAGMSPEVSAAVAGVAAALAGRERADA
jgi:hydrogenase maturation protease